MDTVSRIIFWMNMHKNNNDIYYHIARTILLHMDKMATIGIEELALMCYTSPATISRFCRKLSCPNFTELKRSFLKYDAYKKNEVQFSAQDLVKINDSPHELIEKTLPITIHALMETYKILDMRVITEITQHLQQAQRIAIFGTIYSQLVAQDCQYKLLRLSKFATAFTDSNDQQSDAEALTSQDVAIFFSVSGKSQTLEKLCQTARTRATTTIIISSDPTTKLAQMASFTIPVGGKESSFTQSSISGRIALMSIVDLLYISLAFNLQTTTK